MKDANGAWIGWGLGDVDPKVAAIKAFLKKKFSYAAGLDNSNTYDQALVNVVSQMQNAYGDNSAVNPSMVVNGIMNFAWQVRCGFIKPPAVVLPTWQGTGVDMWNDGWPQPAAIAKAIVAVVGSKAVWQPIGNYPASVTGPAMGASAQMGVDEACRIFTGSSGPGPFFTSGPIFPIGYSQGAICLSWWWRNEVLNPAGRCHNRVNDVIGAITLGNPLRCPGKANGNAVAGWGMPPKKDGATTGGIAGPDCLTAEQTPDWFYDYVWLGSDQGQTELYTANPDGDNVWAAQAPAGFVGTLIYNAVMQQSFTTVVSVIEALGYPIGMIEEIYNGITFLFSGPNADHFAYDIGPMITYGIAAVNKYNNDYVTSGGAVA